MASTGPDDIDPLLEAYIKREACSCPSCAYNLQGLQTARCPECGETLVLMLKGASTFTDYHFGWGQSESYYNGAEYHPVYGYLNCDIVRIRSLMGYTPYTGLEIFGERPGMEYGMSWNLRGYLDVKTVGVALPNRPSSLIR